MRAIIAGSRDITDYKYVSDFINSLGLHITTVVSGAARGVDRLGEQWAYEHDIPIKRYHAAWQLGPKAGYERNVRMAENADCVIVVHNNSKGSLHMINIARERGLPVYELLNSIG